MPSGSKRRKAAKKKKEKETATAIIPSGNDDVKVIESDDGENSSPASQDLEEEQNPFTKDENYKEPSRQTESVEGEEVLNGDGDVVEIVVETELENANDDTSVKGSVELNHDSVKKSSNGSLSREKSVDDDDTDGSQAVVVELHKEEKEHSQVVTTDPKSSAKEARRVKDLTSITPVVESESSEVFLDKVIHEPESVQVEKSVGSAVAELKPNKYEEKVSPSETFSDLNSESLPLPDTNFTETPSESFAEQLPQSNFLIGSGESHARSSDGQQSPEKEPLLRPAMGPANRTSWIGCCGLLEIFTASSR